MIRKGLTVIIIFLFVGICIIPAIAQDIKKPSQPTSRDDWLYVGGSGPGNYTRIQDAINNATIGDTIFVNDDSSPYNENIVIQKSITLIGENRDTTVILGDESSDAIIVNISASDVSISGFTIQPSVGEPIGISVYKNYTTPDYWNMEIIQNVTIYNNIIKNNNFAGIFGIRLNHGKIYGNIIENCSGQGMYILVSSNTIITNNYVADCPGIGILIDGMWSPFSINNPREPVPENNTISQNTISSNRWGIEVNSGPVNTMIYENNISGNHELGILIVNAWKTQITQNNFINNDNNAYFNAVRFTQLMKNSWDKNYWGEQKKAPVIIHGIYLSLFFLLLNIELPTIAFDWHPAKEPYDI